jgi:hypothetical protein
VIGITDTRCTVTSLKNGPSWSHERDELSIRDKKNILLKYKSSYLALGINQLSRVEQPPASVALITPRSVVVASFYGARAHHEPVRQESLAWFAVELQELFLFCEEYIITTCFILYVQANK